MQSRKGVSLARHDHGDTRKLLHTGPSSTHCSSKHSPQPCSGPASKKELEVDSAPTVQYGHWFWFSSPYPQDPCT